MSPLAGAVLDAPGRRWKIWLMDAAQCAAGGRCLFDDEPSAQAFLAGPVMAGLKDHPGLAGLSVQQFDVMEAETAQYWKATLWRQGTLTLVQFRLGQPCRCAFVKHLLDASVISS